MNEKVRLVFAKEKIPQSGSVENEGGVKIQHAGFYTFVNSSR
jgi:hypothetical protein